MTLPTNEAQHECLREIYWWAHRRGLLPDQSGADQQTMFSDWEDRRDPPLPPCYPRVVENPDVDLRRLEQLVLSGNATPGDRDRLVRAYQRSGEIPPRWLWREVWGTPSSERLHEALGWVSPPPDAQFGGSAFDLADEDEVFVGIVAAADTFMGPHLGSVYVEQNRCWSSTDTALQRADEELYGYLQDQLDAEEAGEYWESLERGFDSISEQIRYVPHRGGAPLTPREAAAAFAGTPWLERGIVTIMFEGEDL